MTGELLVRCRKRKDIIRNYITDEEDHLVCYARRYGKYTFRYKYFDLRLVDGNLYRSLSEANLTLQGRNPLILMKTSRQLLETMYDSLEDYTIEQMLTSENPSFRAYAARRTAKGLWAALETENGKWFL